MTQRKWYPAAAMSAVVLGCGGSADNGNHNQGNTGGTTSIDTGAPTNTSGGMVVYYGVMWTGGAGGCDYGACPAGGGWPAGGNNNTGGAYSMGGTSPLITGVCTPGADQTCNDNATVSTLMGHCEADGSCTCGNGYVNKWSNSGKCTTPDQLLCYSPTQNIDNAYVDRAFGCNCDSSKNTAFCGVDSSGLLVYLVCTNNLWQSGKTSNCSTQPSVDCFSPTQNVDVAYEPDAVGCICNSATSQYQCVSGVALLCTNNAWQAEKNSGPPCTPNASDASI